MDLFAQVLSLDEFKNKPPVLLDIGASGRLHPAWKKITKYSVCIACDPDNRAFGYNRMGGSRFKKLYVIDKIVAEKNGKKRFYLTKSPYCSSTLRPNTDKLKDWSFQELFQVEKTAELQTVSLPTVLNNLSLHYIDWFKTDSQGTDLRIFRSLGSETISSIMVAEFEPGIMDAYVNEDKMHQVMAFMEDHPFWLSDLTVKGPQRIQQANLKKKFNVLEQRFLSCFLKSSPFWGEMTYINTFESEASRSKRNLLLGWIFCTLQQQHGFAIQLAQLGKSLFGGLVFQALERESVRTVKQNCYKLPFYLLKKVYEKFIG